MTATKKDLLCAIAKAKAKFPPILKDAKNPHFKQMYATLGAILSAVEMPLIDCGVVIIHEQIPLDNGGWLLQTSLVHWETDQAISTVFPANGADPQKLGSALTYARRYNILNLLNLTTEDDDGNAASQSAAKSQEKPDHIAKLKAERERLGLSTEWVKEVCEKTEGWPNSPLEMTPAQVDQLIAHMTASVAAANATNH